MTNVYWLGFTFQLQKLLALQHSHVQNSASRELVHFFIPLIVPYLNSTCVDVNYRASLFFFFLLNLIDMTQIVISGFILIDKHLIA